MEGCCPLFDQVEVIVYYIWVGVDDNTQPFHYSSLQSSLLRVSAMRRHYKNRGG
jgi:hypothetical protein